MAREDLNTKQVPRSGPSARPHLEPASPFLNVSEQAPGVTLLMVPEVGSCPFGPEVTYTCSWRFGDGTDLLFNSKAVIPY